MEFLFFTDGAASGNPGPAGWGFVATDLGKTQVYERSGCSSRATNNQMELLAVTEAISFASELGARRMIVCTDSSYVLDGATKWMRNWKKNGWKTVEGKAVQNQKYWEALDAALANGPAIKWVKVKGHLGIPGNERADSLAVNASKDQSGVDLSYSYAEYGTELKVPEAVREKGKTSAGRPSPGYPIYLSLVRGEVLRHKTWPECQNRVNGVSGARYKKVRSSEEEKSILDSWGHSEA